MKRLLLSATLSLLAIAPTNAAIVVPGANGTDGALNITQDTVIDLSKATTGTWDQDNSANAGKGVYDPAKWAVIFKYQSVTVASGKKLTFKLDPERESRQPTATIEENLEAKKKVSKVSTAPTSSLRKIMSEAQGGAAKMSLPSNFEEMIKILKTLR